MSTIQNGQILLYRVATEPGKPGIAYNLKLMPEKPGKA